MSIIDSSLALHYPSAVVASHLASSKKRPIESGFDYNDLVSIPSIEEHNKVLAESLRLAKFWCFIAVLVAIFSAMRWYVWMLYAQSLGQDNTTTLGFVIYACYFMQGISAMFWAAIGDKYRYDTLITVLTITQVCGVAIEWNAPNFNVLVVGTMLLSSTCGILSLILAFFAKYLPNEYAIKYTSYIYVAVGFSHLVGPVLTGVVAHFFNYRAVFTVSTGILSFALVYILCFVFGSQEPLEMKQRRMKSLYITLANNSHSVNSDLSKSNKSKNKNKLLCEDSQFPVCIERFGFISKPHSTQKQQNKHDISMEDTSVLEEILDNGMCINETVEVVKAAKHSVSCYTWFMMINVLLANACILAGSGVAATYYLLYCKKELNETIIVSTLQLASFVSLFIIACVATPPLLKRFPNCEYIILFIGHFTNIPLWFFVFQRMQDKGYMRWVMLCVAGIGMGIIGMTQEVMLLNVQPKQHAGKVSGAKSLGRMVIKAFACLAVGVLWTYDVLWFLWVMGCLYVISLLFTFILFFTQKCYKCS